MMASDSKMRRHEYEKETFGSGPGSCIGLFSLGGGSEWYGDIPSYYHNRIVNTITTVQWNIRDLNRDGKVNCIDYAVMFKLEWDKASPGAKNECRIVRNKNAKFHHLFIQVYYSDYNYVLVEHWAANPNKYKMEDNWDRRYDYRYNIYGETSM